MSFHAVAVLLLWLPLCAGLMATLPPLRAVAWGYLGAMLLLPTGTLPLSGIPDIDKWQMTGLGLSLGVLLFQSGSLSRMRLVLSDWLLLGFVASTGITSLINGLGAYDAVSSLLRSYLVFGAPYFLVRLFCRSDRHVYLLTTTIILAAALYAIPAVWEWRMSPQTHRAVYGYSFQGWREHYRFGFYRPLLFFEHGIPLGFFFAGASIMSVYLWLRGGLRRIWILGPKALVGLTTLGTIVSMTLGAWFAWGVALATLPASRGRWSRYAALIPLLVGMTWSASRYADIIDTQPLIDMAYRQFETSRAESFEYRLIADSSLLERAREARWFGWGGWGRNRIGAQDKWGNPVAVDAMWVSLVGKYGLVGLGLFYAWLATATVRGLGCLENLRSRETAAITYALVVMAGLEVINWQLNGFVNPTVLFGAAMLASLTQMNPQPPCPALPIVVANADMNHDGRIDYHPQL